MNVDLSDREREFLATLVEQKANELIHEKNHAVVHDYKETLRREIETAEKVLAKLMVAAATAG